MSSISTAQAYIVKAGPVIVRPNDETFGIYQWVEHAEDLDADNATTILDDLVHLAAHLDLATNPFHNDLVGTSRSPTRMCLASSWQVTLPTSWRTGSSPLHLAATVMRTTRRTC